VLSIAEEWEWIAAGKNPTAGRLRLPVRVATRERRIPTPDEFRALVEALRQPYQAIVCLAGLGGLRRGELAALRWNDFEGNLVRVDEAVYRGVLDTPKSVKSRRIVSFILDASSFVDDQKVAPRKTPDCLLTRWQSNDPRAIDEFKA